MTISESLISILIFTLIIGAVISIFLIYNNVYKIEVAYNELNSHSSIALNRVTQNIRGASGIEASHTINSTEYSTDSDTIILKLPSIDVDENIIVDTYDYLVYFRDPIDETHLKSDLEPDPLSSRSTGQNLVSEFVDKLNFNYNDLDYGKSDKVEIILTTKKLVSNKVKQIIMQTTTTLRNY